MNTRLLRSVRRSVPLSVPGALVTLLLLLSGALSVEPVAAQVPRVQIEVLALSPEPGERVPEEAVLVAASFVDRGAELDPGSVRVEVDGRDVTPEAEVSAEVVTWRPRQALPPGLHRVTVTARTRGGAAIPPATWAFKVESTSETVAARLQPGATGTGFSRFQGSVTFEGSSFNVSPGRAPICAGTRTRSRGSG